MNLDCHYQPQDEVLLSAPSAAFFKMRLYYGSKYT